MGIWSTTATSAGGAIQRQRWWGILEILVASPTRLILVLAPITTAIAASASTRRVNAPLGTAPLRHASAVEHPLLFALSMPAAVALGRPARSRARLDVRRLPLGFKSVAGARVPRLDDHRAAHPAIRPPGLGRAVRLGARDDLGHARCSTRSDRRRRRRPAARCASALTSPTRRSAAVLLHHFERLARDRASLSLT